MPSVDDTCEGTVATITESDGSNIRHWCFPPGAVDLELGSPLPPSVSIGRIPFVDSTSEVEFTSEELETLGVELHIEPLPEESREDEEE